VIGSLGDFCLVFHLLLNSEGMWNIGALIRFHNFCNMIFLITICFAVKHYGPPSNEHRSGRIFVWSIDLCLPNSSASHVLKSRMSLMFLYIIITEVFTCSLGRRWDSSVTIVMGRGWIVEAPTPVRGKVALGPSQPRVQWVCRALLARVKQ
jgi:hypothetical protein